MVMANLIVNLIISGINENSSNWVNLWQIVLGFFGVGRPILNLGHIFWYQPPQKDAEKECFCLLALTLAGNFIYPSAETFLHWY